MKYQKNTNPLFFLLLLFARSYFSLTRISGGRKQREMISLAMCPPAKPPGGSSICSTQSHVDRMRLVLWSAVCWFICTFHCLCVRLFSRFCFSFVIFLFCFVSFVVVVFWGGRLSAEFIQNCDHLNKFGNSEGTFPSLDKTVENGMDSWLSSATHRFECVKFEETSIFLCIKLYQASTSVYQIVSCIHIVCVCVL